MNTRRPFLPALIVFASLLSAVAALPDRESRLERRKEATEKYPDLALKLENPLARILVLPIAMRYEDGVGVGSDGSRYSLRLNPRLPFVLNDDWHLISQSELLWMSQSDVSGPGSDDGLGDLTQAFLFSPDRSIAWNTYWGLGPSFVVPIASNDALGSRKFSLGPALSFFRQSDSWTAGLLIAHVWSVAGDSDAADVSFTRIQPLVAYTTSTSTTLSLGLDGRYNWTQEKWQLPLLLSLSQLTLIAKHPLKFALGAELDLANDSSGADWGLQFKVSIPFETPW